MLGVLQCKSLSARRAWIEIANFCRNRFCPTVALRKESVDRNSIAQANFRACTMVALRKESVDRNRQHKIVKFVGWVALRKESVDRNGLEINGVSYDVWSLSARRAWIEIAAIRLAVLAY